MNLLGSAQSKERVFKLPIRLTPKQLEVERNDARYKIIRAGRKFGKTTFALYQMLRWMGQPNAQVWFLSPTYKMGKLIAWQELKRMIPPEALKRKPNDTDLVITLKNGSEGYIIGTDDMDNIRGLKPSGVIFEEAAMHKDNVWQEVVRPNLLVHKAPALFISTPKGFNWFKDLEDNAHASIARGEKEWAAFHFTSYDNPYIDQAELEKDRIACGDQRIWNQEYLAEYESSVGRVFSAFSDSAVHHVKPVKVALGQVIGRAIDWGMRDDTGALWGFVSNRTLHVYREHAENNLPPSAQAQIILNRTPKAENVQRNIIGHDAVKQDLQMRGITVAWHFQNAGIRPLKIGSKNKEASRGLLQQLFRENRIVIDPSCTKLRKQLLKYEWKDTALENTSDDNVDLVDALHYLAELYQYDLASDVRLSLSVADQIKQAKEEIAAHNRSTQKFALPTDRSEPNYDFAGAAGYIA